MAITNANSTWVKSLQGKRENHRESFARSFTKGYGCAGLILGAARPASRLPLFSHLLKASLVERQLELNEKKWKIVRGYVGKGIGNALSSTTSSAAMGRARDAQMIGRDVAQATLKVHA